MPIKEAWLLVILKFFQDPSCKITALMMGCRKNFGMTKTLLHPSNINKAIIKVNPRYQPEKKSGLPFFLPIVKKMLN